MSSKPKIVEPYSYSGMNVSWNLNLFSGPMFQIICGDCLNTFKARLPNHDYPIVKCPYCETFNKFNLVYR